MEMDAYFFIFILTILIIIGFVSRKRSLENRVVRGRGRGRGRGKLPPGSMGWPYIGETLQLYSQNPSAFFASKQRRHGEIFKTHILGCPCVMLASPEAARFVLVTHAHLFKPTYPKSKENFIGPSALFFHQGENHMRLRKLVQGSLTLNNLKNMVGDLDAIFSSAFDSLAGGHVVNTFLELKEISFEVGIRAVFGGNQDTHQYTEELKKNYAILAKGYNSFPSVIPGTLYYKAKMARRRLSAIFEEIINLRREKRLAENDLLGSFLNYKGEHSEVLSNNQIIDNIIGVLFAAQDTTASVMTWTIKFLHDNPKVLEAVKAEQNAIHKINNGGPLTWSQTREMPISYKLSPPSLRPSPTLSAPLQRRLRLSPSHLHPSPTSPVATPSPPAISNPPSTQWRCCAAGHGCSGDAGEKRIKENLERMHKLGIFDMSMKLKSAVLSSKPVRKRKAFKAVEFKNSPVSQAELVPRPSSTRRSCRLQNVTPMSYVEVGEERKGNTTSRSRNI